MITIEDSGEYEVTEFQLDGSKWWGLLKEVGGEIELVALEEVRYEATLGE